MYGRTASHTWTYDRYTGLYYLYDIASDTLLFSDGRKVARPAHISRDALLKFAAPASLQPVQSYSPTCNAPWHPVEELSHTPRYPGSITSDSVSTQNGGAYSQPHVQPFQRSVAPWLPSVPLSPSPPSYAYTGSPRQNRITPRIGQVATQTVQTRQQSSEGSIWQPYRSYSPRSDGHARNELLSGQYRIRTAKFFQVGRVFRMLWSEPLGGTGSRGSGSDTLDSIGATEGRYGEQVWSKLRWFVAVRVGDRHCLSLAINTYAGRGVGKQSTNKAEHSIIYTGKTAPSLAREEAPSGEEKAMLPHPIRVVPDQPQNKLDPMSRLDYGKVYTVMHDFKVMSFGLVHSDSIQHLLMQFAIVIDPYSAKYGAFTRPGFAQGSTSAKNGLHVEHSDDDTEYEEDGSEDSDV